MLSKIAKFTFGTSRSGGFNILGAVNRFKSALSAPIKHIKRNIEPSGVNYSPQTNTTEEAFDEVAHEWQALVVSNPFDLQTFNYLDNAQSTNFGTVDNPLVVFTADTPFRYVGCTGQMNEDDYEGHELLFFMLREGPLQRCPQCGQVYKLVRLRNEYSPEMDYYLSNFHPYEMQEMGESDTTILMSVPKMNTHYEYTQFENPSNMVYSLVNSDEHDRLLIDPAYRLERAKQMAEKYAVYVFSLQKVDEEFKQKFGPPYKIPINKIDYTTLVDVEQTILRLDRQFRKVARFHSRRFNDTANHERREKRMRERAANRWDGNYTFYYGGLTEEEQMYRDYFETDLEKYPEDEVQEQLLDQQEVLTQPEYQLNKYDFQERYTRYPEDDQTSLIEKKAFKFKYRMARDPKQVYERRNKRMIARQIERLEKTGAKKIFNELNTAILKGDNYGALIREKQWMGVVVNESIQQYKDYFESDGEEDFSVFNNMSKQEELHMVSSFENHAIAKYDTRGYVKLPKRPWEHSFGLWKNFLLELQETQQVILPKARSLANSAARLSVEPLSKEELIEAGIIKADSTFEKKTKEAPKIDKPTTEQKQKK